MLLSAASESYQEALTRLPADREAAAPLLSQALDTYREAGEKAHDDPVLKRLAELGIARTYEARNELADAIAQYEKVAKDWPGTDDAKAATERAKLLRDPETVAFYEKFAAYKPPTTPTLPPRGTSRFDLPLGHPALDSLKLGPIPTKAEEIKPGELPKDVFQAPTPKPGSEAVPPGPPLRDPDIPDVFPRETKDEPAKAPKP